MNPAILSAPVLEPSGKAIVPLPVDEPYIESLELSPPSINIVVT